MVIFRTDGSKSIGLGHVRRCLSLASALRQRGRDSLFLISGDSRAVEVVADAGFEACQVDLENDLPNAIHQSKDRRAQAIVIDSYAIDKSYLFGLGATKAILVSIDDLADRELPVDLVVNGAVNARELSYRTSLRTRLLLGPEYILLREEFSQEVQRPIRTSIERVLITVGGMDAFALTPRLVAWTREVLGPVWIDAVIGPFFNSDCVRQVEVFGKGNGFVTVHRDPADFRRLLLACDMTISGGGQTAYEAAATGTPAVAIQMAGNQAGNLEGLTAKGVLWWVGDAQDKDLHEKVLRALVQLSGDPGRREAMSRSGRWLVDGCGAQRVATAMLDICNR